MTHAFTPHPPPPALCADPAYAELKKTVVDATGLAYYLDKDDDFADRISRRLQAVDAADCAAYLEILQDPQHGEAELDRLIEQLTVGETSFFRHPEIFDGLRTAVMPDLLERNRSHRRLRIWCAGCSVGAEVYTLAILFAREFAGPLRGWDVSIVGTDINRAFLARARAGVFSAWHLRGLDQNTLDECFVPAGNEWAIRPEYKRGVSFQYHNLVRNPFPSLLGGLTALDVIFCRNVLIYFNPELMRKIVGQFRESLVENGWLLVGHAEPNVSMFRQFRTINVPGAVLYQKPSMSSVREPVDEVPLVPLAPSPHQGTKKDLIEAPSTIVKPRPRGRRASTGVSHELAEIERLASAGDLDSAVRCCERLAADRPTDPAPHLRLAMLAEQLGRHRQAEASLRRTLAISPENALAHYLSGLLEQKSGRRAGAISAYARAIRALDAEPEATVLVGLDGLTAGELRELARMQQEVLSA